MQKHGAVFCIESSLLADELGARGSESGRVARSVSGGTVVGVGLILLGTAREGGEDQRGKITRHILPLLRVAG